jgi:hypothetical protein
MGGVEIDLRQSATATGEAVLDVLAICGGIKVRVPPDWTVVNESVAIMGGSEDRTGGVASARHRLVVRGIVMMGGLVIQT